jgi:hypothetical protein
MRKYFLHSANEDELEEAYKDCDKLEKLQTKLYQQLAKYIDARREPKAKALAQSKPQSRSSQKRTQIEKINKRHAAKK